MPNTTKATTAVNLTPDSAAYVQALLDTTYAVDGDSRKGSLKIHDNIRNLVYALYHVLAGGSAACSVTHPENATALYTITITPKLDTAAKAIFDNLVQMEVDCTKAINDTNKAFSGNYKLVMEF